MRISTEPNDPGFIDNEKRPLVKVFFNNQELEDCVTADDEKGYVKCTKKDSQGRYIVNGDELEHVDYFGDVRIEPKNG